MHKELSHRDANYHAINSTEHEILDIIEVNSQQNNEGENLGLYYRYVEGKQGEPVSRIYTQYN